MGKFSDRLKLQKSIFLIQSQGINLGFTFSLYIHGPYSKDLTKMGYYITDFNKIRKVKFANEDTEKKFLSFLDKIQPYKDNVNWLEIASTLCLFKEMYPKKDKGGIVKGINELKPQFNMAEIDKVWGEINGWLLQSSS